MESTFKSEKHCSNSLDNGSRKGSNTWTPMPRQNETSSINANLSKISDSNVHHLSFPAKLHVMLARPDIADVISWMPHGRAWRVHKPKAFEKKVIPMFFVQCKYSSFIRQANGWGFRRITKGLDRNAYYHKSFLRGCPDLCKSMRRPATSAKVALNKGEAEPNFYKLTEIDPLPGVFSPSKIALMNNLVVPEFRLKSNSGDTNKSFQRASRSLPKYLGQPPSNKNEFQINDPLHSFQRTNTLPPAFNHPELASFRVPLGFEEIMKNNINLNQASKLAYNNIVLKNLLLKERISAGITLPQNQFPLLPLQFHPGKISYTSSNLAPVGSEILFKRHTLNTRNYLHNLEALNRSGQNNMSYVSLKPSNTNDFIRLASNPLSLNSTTNPTLNRRETTQTNDLKNKVGRLLTALSTQESENTLY